MTGYVATAETEVAAPAEHVWAALTDPGQIEQYMFGSHVESGWKAGDRIVWRGEYEGRRYEDHGEILEVEPGRRLVMTHYSPLGGADDVPENYHTLTYELHQADGTTRLTLTQDANASPEAAEHSRANWEKVLSGLKAVVEKRSPDSEDAKSGGERTSS